MNARRRTPTHRPPKTREAGDQPTYDTRTNPSTPHNNTMRVANRLGAACVLVLVVTAAQQAAGEDRRALLKSYSSSKSTSKSTSTSCVNGKW